MLTAIFAAVGMLVLILDAQTAMAGAKAGIELCLGTVVPSLLPFFILSMMLTSALLGRSPRFLRPLGRFCGMPMGSESLLIVGLLGGYPVGAQNISYARSAGQLTDDDARHLLSFCSNAGPAFLFGMAAAQFSQRWMGWVLWGIHILSALLTARLFRRRAESEATLTPGTPLSLPMALERALRVMASVCGWVVLFRVVIAFLERWFLWLLPETGQVLVSGLLELSNGCLMLGNVENTGLRMVLCSVFLAFGGVCVTMQTVSVTAGMKRGSYFKGKLCQTVLTFLLAWLAQLCLLPGDERWDLPAVVPVVALLALILPKLAVAFHGKMVYNGPKSQKKRCILCCSEKTSPVPANTASGVQCSMTKPSSAPKRAS